MLYVLLIDLLLYWDGAIAMTSILNAIFDLLSTLVLSTVSPLTTS